MIAEPCLCYTGDILDSSKTKYTLSYYVKMAKELEKRGAHILGINAQASTTADRLVEMLPGAVSKVSGFFAGRKESAPAEAPAADAPASDEDPKPAE